MYSFLKISFFNLGKNPNNFKNLGFGNSGVGFFKQSFKKARGRGCSSYGNSRDGNSPKAFQSHKSAHLDKDNNEDIFGNSRIKKLNSFG